MGNVDQYKEALYFIRHDNIDDSQQQAEIQDIEAKLAELTEE
jgi:hypothetical protein